MANFSVMADVPNPVFDSNGNPFSGAVLKAYLPGTTTSTSIAIDEDGASPQASITYNAAGKLEVSGNEILPYIDIKHKWGIFSNAADAAANTPFYMGSFDNVPPGVSAFLINDLSQPYTFPTVDGVLGYKQSTILFPVGKTIHLNDRDADFLVISGTGTANTFDIIASTSVIQSINLDKQPVMDAKSFGVDSTGVLTQTAIDRLIAYQDENNNVAIQISDGIYLIDGIQISHDESQVIFVGDVTLRANTNDKVLFNQSGSFAMHKGTFRTDSNGKTGVIGMMCAPEDRTQTTTLVQTNHNQMPGIRGDANLELAIGLKCGPDVGGTDSGCFYNVFPFGRGRGSVGGVRFFPGPNASSSSPNRNTFRDYRQGTEGGVSSNFGLWIESGDTNKFFGCDFEGIGSGTPRVLPLATPTAVKIEETDINGIDNNFNTFFGGQCEANTRDLDIANPRTFLYGMGYSDASSILPTSNVFKTIPARDSSGSATRLLGIKTLDDDIMIITSISVGDDDGAGGAHLWNAYVLNTTLITQGGVDITAIAQNSSYARQINQMTTWHFRFAFTAVHATDNLVIPLPPLLTPQVNLYTAAGSAQTMKFPCTITNGTTHQAGFCNLSATDLTIETGLNWNTASNVNAVWVQIDYHAV